MCEEPVVSIGVIFHIYPNTKGRRLEKCDKTKLRTVVFFLHAWETRDMTNKKKFEWHFSIQLCRTKIWGLIDMCSVVIYAPFNGTHGLFLMRPSFWATFGAFVKPFSQKHFLILQKMNLIQCCYSFFMSSRKENVIFVSLTKTVLSNLLFLPVHLIEALN